MKNYTSAPLPFVGQKRNFIKSYQKVLANLPSDTIIVDLFGGSGLLSHVGKRERPDLRVIYNDFDGFEQRLNAIQSTNELLSKIRKIVASCPRSKMLPKEVKERILSIVEGQEHQDGYIDYITLSASLLFSMKHALSLEELRKETLYNNVRQSDYIAAGYLDGLEIVHMDYRELFSLYKDNPKALFLVDPPYLSTDCSTYTMRWTLADYLDVLTVLHGHQFIYFTSNKSNIIELCEWLGKNEVVGNPFEKCKKVTTHRRMNYNSAYTDIMFYN